MLGLLLRREPLRAWLLIPLLSPSVAALQDRPWERAPTELASRDERALGKLDEAGREALEARLRERFPEVAPEAAARIQRLCGEGIVPLAELPEPYPVEPLDVSELDDEKRKRVPAGSQPWRRLVESLVAEPPRRLAVSPVWERRVRYDDARGSVVRVSDDALVPLRNALRGYHPDVDWAEALLRQALDREGRHRARAVVLSHEYVDGDLRSYEGIPFAVVERGKKGYDLPDAEALMLCAEHEGMPPAQINRTAVMVTGIPFLFLSLQRHRRTLGAVALSWLCPDPWLPGVEPEVQEAIHAVLRIEREDVGRMEQRILLNSSTMLQPDGLPSELGTPEERMQGEERRARMRAEAEAMRAAAKELLHGR